MDGKMDIVDRLRASAMDSDNFPRMMTERGASVRDCLEAAATITTLRGQIEELTEELRYHVEEY